MDKRPPTDPAATDHKPVHGVAASSSSNDLVLVSRDGSDAVVLGSDGLRAVMRAGVWSDKGPAFGGEDWVTPDATRAAALSSAARKALSFKRPTSDPKPESADQEATFPSGTRFFNVEGTPVAWSPLPDGGMRLGAYDPDLRFFPMSSVERNGMEVDAAAFERLRKRPPLEPSAPPWQPTGDGPKGLLDRLANPAPGPDWRAFALNGRPLMVDAHGFNSIEGTLNGWTWNSVPAGVAEGAESMKDADEVLVSRDGTLAAVIGDDGFRAVLRDGAWRSKDPATFGDDWVTPDDKEASALSIEARKALSLKPPTSDPRAEVEEGAKSVTEPTFADRLRFFDVEGTPVAIVPTPDGGFDVRAFDPDSRRFSLGSVERNGMEVDEAAFERLKAKFQAGSRNDTVDDKSKAPLAPGPNWRAWSYNGRIIWLDPDEFESRELSPDCAWRVSTPACVVARDGEPVMDAGGRGEVGPFPSGTLFYDVEGTPVAIIVTSDGGFDVMAFDGPESRRFSLSSVLRNGSKVDAEAFARLSKLPPTGNSALPPQPQAPDAAQAFLARWGKLPKGALAEAIAKRDAEDQEYLKQARARAAKFDQTPK